MGTSNWKPTSQKETSPLAHFVRTMVTDYAFHGGVFALWIQRFFKTYSLPKSSLLSMIPRFFDFTIGYCTLDARAIALHFVTSSPAKRSHLGSLGKLSKIHPLLILQVDSLRSASFSLCKLALLILLVCCSFAQWLQIMLFMGVCLHFGSKDFLKHIVYQNLAFSR